MISVKEKNRYKIIDGTKLKEITESSPTLFKDFHCFYNNALGGIWCHNKSFGSNDDFKYGSEVGMNSQFHIEEGYIDVSCYAYGGMTGFIFNTEEIESLNKFDRLCAIHTIDFIKSLYFYGVIENPEKEDN